jgi:integrase/recombinase XerD
MNHNKLSVLFYLNKARVNQKRTCSIKCRLTFLGKRKTFSTGLFLNPGYWKSKQQKASPPNPDTIYINSQLSLISQKINEAFLILQVSDQLFDVEDIYLKFKGESTKANKTLLEVFDIHNSRMKRLIGKEYQNSTYRKFIEARNHTSNFIKYKYNKTDMLLNAINMNFIQDFDFLLEIGIGS